MVNYCRIHGCHNRSDRESDRSFYRLPEVIENQCELTMKLSAERRRLWLAKLDQDFSGKNLKNIRVCSDHFIYKKRAELFDRDNPDWIPSVNLGTRKSLTLLSPEMASDRYKRRKDRNIKTEVARTLLQLQESGQDEPLQDSMFELGYSTTVETQTDVDVNQMTSMESDVVRLTSENVILRNKLRSCSYFSLEAFEANDEKVKYYTGLPCFSILMTLYTFLEAYLPCRSVIGKFEGLTMTLARLRLNLSVNHLAYQMNTSMSTVSRTLLNVIDIMYVRMKPVVMWPEREELRKTMPMQFRKQFGLKCAVIIDCFEVFIERPSNLKARAETWSSYKHHNTVKFLLGITPQGVVSFISNSWGGRCSDKHITDHCGFLDRILPGDIVLADRGFDIQASLGVVCAEARIPAFTKGKSQLSPVDIETTRKLANVRIHVERVIGLVRQKYTILNATLPIDMVITKDKTEIPTIDKIAHICCALVNLCDSVVDFN